MLALLFMAQVAPAVVPMPAFLTGCWQQRTAEKWTEECWTSPRGGMMLGSAREGTANKVNHWEWMRIERGTNGALTFYASPKGAPPAAFKAATATANEIVFINAAHDYPQRIRYLRTAGGIEAEISLADGAKPTRWSYGAIGVPAR
ncbi:MAG: DUF6265 family protein [Pseudomonadota bacterium]|nr:DUF6265 family protein [Pseudomonadota bacterium]